MIGRIAAPFESENKKITHVVNAIDNSYPTMTDPKNVISAF